MADPPNKSDLVSSNHTEQLITMSSVLELEAGVQVGVRLLEDLKTLLNAHEAGSPQVAQWLQEIQQVEEKAKPARTVVGVVGVTGAGKSSLINAVLDEERLVPTSGIRACTASATEISYNHSDDPNELYRAEVEFIGADEWSREFKALLEDLLDGNGNISHDRNNPDSPAGLAYSKIKTLYPNITNEEIVRRASDPSEMAQEPSVHQVLGSVKLLRATSSSDLYEGLQQYIDSKEKTSSQMEYWPLIKVVRIYRKARALSTGVVLVDLPGVQDINAARAAIADRYIKVCTGLWITADIQRATDDEAAQKILGDSLKRQLRYDGALSAVTFICTKADEILESEAKKSLNIEVEAEGYEKRIQVLDRRRDELNTKIKELKKQKDVFEEQLEDLEVSSNQWKQLLGKLKAGETVYRPPETSKKRKRKTSPGRAHKTRGSANDLSDSDDIYGSDDAGDRDDHQASQAQKTPLAKDEIEGELASLEALERGAYKSNRSLDKEIAKFEEELAEVSDQKTSVRSEMRAFCIRSRSDYAKDSIKRGFAMGIKELDEERAIEEDEAHFDPAKEIRDYGEVARSLPVFCVSARASQKLSGRFENDAVHIVGFTSPDDTEIPQLQEHAKSLTESGRMSTSRLFLTELRHLLNSMKLWAAGSARASVSGEGQNVDENTLRACLTRLHDALRQAVTDCHASMKQDLEKQLYETFDRLIPTASDSAVEIAKGWGVPRSQGGLYWATYKATCSRDGTWAGRAGSRDFNEELFEPLKRQLTESWERTFQQRIPWALRKFIDTCRTTLEAFHVDVATNVAGVAANPAGLSMLAQQKQTHQIMLNGSLTVIDAEIMKSQREANRGFAPVIQEVMQPAYDTCARERGAGTTIRMKSTMESHVDTARNTMFRQACDAVKGQLDKMCADVEQHMKASVENLSTKLHRDYLATLVGEGVEVPLAERILHEQVRPILEGADIQFA